jgi:hypothetical protein
MSRYSPEQHSTPMLGFSATDAPHPGEALTNVCRRSLIDAATTGGG